MAQIVKNIIYKSAQDVATPTAGNTVIFRLSAKVTSKFLKSPSGDVAEIKAKGIVEVNSFSNEYFSIHKSMDIIRGEGYKAIEKLIIKEYNDLDRTRIFNALDKVPSFHIALVHGDIPRAKERVSSALSEGVILQADYNIIIGVLELAEQTL